MNIREEFEVPARGWWERGRLMQEINLAAERIEHQVEGLVCVGSRGTAQNFRLVFCGLWENSGDAGLVKIAL
ncbi:MAG: hypothetical protein P0Y64_16765 [Candidatus Sphingomonas colombiensis]|nr:hypothetical protein [Sphingomonas sp.]WEK42972.1 MAG: hypothetical protein P0Y64_16765 [Sphingomonas sp.]